MDKLLFFISDYKIGQSCLTTDQMLAIHNSSLKVIAVSSENEQEKGLRDKTKQAGADVRRIFGLDMHSNFISLSKQIAQIITDEDIYCVHVQNNWQMMLLVYAKFILLRRFDLKILYTLHAFRHNNPVKSILARLMIGTMLLLFANKVICMSTYLKRKFFFLGKKTLLLPLGISDDYFFAVHPSLPQNGLQMIFPAQFRKGKNQDLIIRAFARHIKNCNDIDSHLYFPGNGELLQNMKNLVLDLGIADRVSFPGLCTKHEVLNLYLKCNIGVIASNSETFGQCIVEPYVLGRCVVSTHVGIADDILIDGENGYFYSSEDDLVRVFDNLYKNQILIEQAGCINYAARNQFSWKSITERYARVITGL